MPKDVSIEYAHIYSNQYISDEHIHSVKALRKMLEKLTLQNQRVSLVVMVDDYSSPDPTFDYADFMNWLKQEGAGPHHIIRESQLIPHCDEVLAMMHDEKLKRQLVAYIKSKKYPCSLFIAAWYLMRLGKVKSAILSPDSRARRLINILPEHFMPVENQGRRIIESTPYKECVNVICNQYLPPESHNRHAAVHTTAAIQAIPQLLP